ncbi:hypothetical protein Bca52824_035357 [Brassica carinata]|uniref:Uncharacterized protein n=1 Tax=Brassica carinata TaxID=52824 RepID=A0A8X7S572_BRACI|nr:hypothetical protein Bca52824_035357 [Brassica carinata]
MRRCEMLLSVPLESRFLFLAADALSMLRLWTLVSLYPSSLVHIIFSMEMVGAKYGKIEKSYAANMVGAKYGTLDGKEE